MPPCSVLFSGLLALCSSPTRGYNGQLLSIAELESHGSYSRY